MEKNKFIVVIAGPTAVGKTAVAIRLAERFGAEIFSADSRQVYKEMSIGTAKPKKQELEKIKHHFIDQISIIEKYSVGKFEMEIRDELKSYFKHHDVAIVTGGTGLYIRALVEGLDDFPDIPDYVQTKYNNILISDGLEGLQSLLLERDPEYYNIVDLGNARRLSRALCVIEVSGKKFSSFHKMERKKLIPYHIIEILLELPKDVLYERINTRVDEMMQLGLVEEAHKLISFKGTQALETVGYQELFQYFDNKITLENAVDLIKQNSRRYAKRQITWFRKFGLWTSFSPYDFEGIEHFVLNRMLNKGQGC
ncbi:MAG: tRNA (adenosine(37)-N6)-dimethylallyltransferase MiaA [Saprospiraceae bacterium]|nr:tRNA (adenosine(37)-N6)-dimethylallyltransferase MiaA [Saprospiraceae bacterium]